MKTLKTTLFASALVFGCSAAVSAKTIYVGFDVSGSSPIIKNTTFLQSVSENLTKKVAGLNPKDTVIAHTFGAQNIEHIRPMTLTVPNSGKTDKITYQLNQFLANASSKAGEGGSFIINFLTANTFDCSGEDEIILVTDGFENETADIVAVLEKGMALPSAKQDFLKGCNITMLGVGLTNQGAVGTKELNNIRGAWEKWASQAGATVTLRTNP